MAETELIQDLWAPLSHRPLMQGGGPKELQAPGWVGAHDKRRLHAYQVLRAMMDCTARWHLADDPARPNKENEWREFGDPAVFVERIAAGVLGEEQTIVVDGAGDAIPAEPELDRPPSPPAESPDDHPEVAAIAAEVYEAAVAAWAERARAQLDEWLIAHQRQPALVERQKWLRRWADDVRLADLLAENEREHIVPLGSGCYALGWDSAGRRPRVDIYEPDVYFPDLASAEGGAYPTRVDLVWPFMAAPAGDPDAEEEEFVRRRTYELVPVIEAEAAAAAHPDISSISAPLYLAEGAEWTQVCLLTDETIPAEDFKGVRVAAKSTVYATDLVDPADPEGETVVWNRRPIGVDFIPVVHVPHTPSSRWHYGRSPLMRAAQTLDEIAGADVEEALAARWAARMLVGISGLAGGGGDAAIDLPPGKGFRLAENGRLSVADLGANLSQLGDYGARVRKQASIVMAVPDGLVGRLDAAEVPSGITLQLSFTPFQQAVQLARLVRAAKYQLLLKMVQRVAIQAGDETLGGSTEVYPARVELGPFMPQDLAGVAQLLALLLGAKAISQETAIAALIEMGMPIDDAERELARIRQIMAEQADLITSATEAPHLAAKFLGYSESERQAGAGRPEGEDGSAPEPVGALSAGGLLA